MADKNLALGVAKLVDELRKRGVHPTDADLNRLATHIANGFEVRQEEVAILRLSADSQMLSFVIPLKLSRIGAIPITTANSLAVKTIRDKRGEIVNNFTAYKHPTVFEAVDLSHEEKALPIRKIMSSPMLADGEIVGVIQISRKARPGELAGADFTQADLAELNAAGSILGKYLSEWPAPSSLRKVPAKT
jgi:hypothetical protein